jgi:RNA polymerase sigma-70 factor (ECF subfamily)
VAALSSLADEALVGRIAEGDRAALAELYRRHAPALMGLARKLLGDGREAEDLVHDVILETWARAKDFDAARGSARSWIFLRLRSRALDRRTAARVRRQAREPLDTEAMPASTRRAQDRVEAGLDFAHVRTALARVGDETRQILELAYVEGLTLAEVAERMALPLGTVKSRLNRALARLRDELGPQQ